MQFQVAPWKSWNMCVCVSDSWIHETNHVFFTAHLGFFGSLGSCLAHPPEAATKSLRSLRFESPRLPGNLWRSPGTLWSLWSLWQFCSVSTRLCGLSTCLSLWLSTTDLPTTWLSTYVSTTWLSTSLSTRLSTWISSVSTSTWPTFQPTFQPKGQTVKG